VGFGRWKIRQGAEFFKLQPIAPLRLRLRSIWDRVGACREIRAAEIAKIGGIRRPTFLDTTARVAHRVLARHESAVTSE
jgi:hypothetical protein